MTDDIHFKILMVATEAVPLAKEGGVADVIGSLPKELAALGHEVCVFLPRYGTIDPARWALQPTGVVRMIPQGGFDHTVSILQTTLPASPVTVYLLDHEGLFGRQQRLYLGLDQRDEQRRFLLFCRGLLEALPQLGFAPDIIHLNDWQTAPCAAYLRTTHRHLLRHSRSFGIPNGLDWDAWDPATDGDITVPYTGENASSAKVRNRTALRQEFGLPDDPTLPLVGIVSRLVDQKGFDLLAAIAVELGDLPQQLIVLGTGHPSNERLFRDIATSTRNVRASIGFDVALSHRIYAGADFFLMPSAFEPGGLGQLIALRYGTLPIVHATGGLADTVTDLDVNPSSGNGLSFTPYAASALLDALHRALRLYADRERWPGLIARAMSYDSRWSASARAYSNLYQRVLRLPPM